MKKVGVLKLFALVALFFLTLPSARAASLSVPDFDIDPGGSYVATVRLEAGTDPAMNYKGLQFDVKLPDGFTVDANQAEVLAAISNFSLSSYDHGNGVTRFLAYGENATDATGALVAIPIKAGGAVVAGKYPLAIENITFSDPRGNDNTLPATSATMTVYKVTTDGIYIQIPDFAINSGSSTTVNVNIEHGDLSMFDYKGFQFDLQMPDFLSIDFEQSKVTAALNGFTLSYVDNGNGSCRIMVYNGNNGFSTSTDNLITLVFKAAVDAPEGKEIINNQRQIFSTPRGQDMFLTNSVTNVTIIAPQITLTLDPTELNMVPGDIETITATIEPEYMDFLPVIWTSSDPSVATVDAEGNVTAVGPGTCTITATCSNATATATVNVSKYAAGSQYIDIPDFEITAGKTELSPALVINGEEDMFEYRGFQFDIVPPAGVTITNVVPSANLAGYTASFEPLASGGYRILAYGSVTTAVDDLLNITFAAAEDATLGEYRMNITNVIFSTPRGADVRLDDSYTMVTIVENEEITVTVSPEAATIEVGKDVQLEATVKPADADVIISWTSSDTDVATVDENGKVTGVGPGEATITVTITDKEGNVLDSATSTITVVQPVTSLTVTPTELEMIVGDPSVQLTATVTPDNATDKTLVWESSNPNVATVDQDGNVTPVGPGQCVITVKTTDGSDLSATCQVTVTKYETGARYIEIPDFEITAGKTELSPALVINGEDDMFEYQGFQFDLVPPAGLTISDIVVSTALSGYEVHYNRLSNGNYRILAKGPAATETTDLLNITFEASMSATPGEYTMNIINVIFSTPKGQEVNLDDSYTIVTILPTEEVKVTVSPEDATLAVGEDVQLEATVEPEDADVTISWTSSDPDVATVDENGKVTGVGPGEATITVTITDKEGNELDSATSTITVVQPVTSLTVTPTELEMTVNEDPVQLTATVTPEDATDKTLVWESSDPNVATVDQDGNVTPVGPGTCVITVRTTDGSDLSATCNVTVTEYVENKSFVYIPDFTIDAGANIIAPAKVNHGTEPMFEYQGFQFDLVPPAGVTVTNVAVSTALSGFSVVYSEPQPGTYRFLVKGSEGTTADDLLSITFTAASNATGGTYEMPLTNPIFSTPRGKDIKLEGSTTQVTIKVPVSVTIQPDELNLAVGDEEDLTAIVEPDDAGFTFEWSSSDPDVATVDENGHVTAVGEGDADITVKVKDKDGNVVATDTITVTVSSIPATSIEIDPASVTLYVDETQQFTAKVLPENTTDKTVTWTSSDPTIASVDPVTGLVTALKEGEVTITATCGDVSATATVKVITKGELRIKVEPTSMELQEGKTGTITATVEGGEEGETHDIIWTSSDPDVATVDENGNVIAKKPGKVTITAAIYDEDGNVIASATTEVTVTPKTPVEELIPTPGTGTTEGDPDATVAENTEDGAVLIGKDILMRVGQTATVVIETDPVVDYDPALVWTLAEGGATLVSLSVNDDNSLVATFTGLEIGNTIYTVYASTNPSASTTGKIKVIAANPIVALTLNPSELELEVSAEPYQLEAVITPENASVKTLKWTSSNEAVATVDQNGVVTPVAVGVTKVTATTTDGTNLSASSTVTVIEDKIPDNPFDDIEVTLSEQYFIVESGTEVNMWAKVKGGNPDGWIYEWTLKDSTDVLSQTGELNITAVNENEEPLIQTYILDLSNSYQTELLFDAEYEFVVEIWRKGEIDTAPDIAGWHGNDNGTFVSAIKIREGNELGMRVNEPFGGYMNEWEYLWTDEAGKELGTESEIWIPAELNPQVAASAGDRMAISENVYDVTVTNYGPDDSIWMQQTLPTRMVYVYKRPQAPTQLLRKGDGTSYTFVVMMTPLDNQQILDLGYSYVYGYTDAQGNMHELARTPLRYTHTTNEIYNNSSYKFWAYSLWTYPDGSVVSSGLRYLDGSEDYDFDASSFEGATKAIDAEAGEVIGIYTLEGQYLGVDTSRLQQGIYVIRHENLARKIIIF